MKAKPEGPRYRNLFARGGVIYYQRKVGARRFKRTLETSSWEEAASRRDAYEQMKGIGRRTFVSGESPRLADFALRYLAEDTDHLAPTTKHDRPKYLRKHGPILGPLGARRLDEITPAVLRVWWNTAALTARVRPKAAKEGDAGPAPRAVKTKRGYLDVLASVLGYAVDLGLLESNPVPAFRETVRRLARTQAGRAGSDPGRNIRPIEHPDEIERLVGAARTQGPVATAYVLALLDAGLRVGEALGLRWGSVAWGADEDDPRRALLIDRSRPRGGAEGHTKSGRARRVALSRRLRAALAELYHQRFKPGPDALVLEGLDSQQFYFREWRRICDQAGIGRRALKDLRDTFASQLLTAGVQLGYVSLQLGHSDVGTTARHYARWAGGDLYRSPMQLAPGEVPADFLARLVVDAFRSDPKVTPGDPMVRETPTDAYAENASDAASLSRAGEWFPGMDSNHHKQVQRPLSGTKKR